MLFKTAKDIDRIPLVQSDNKDEDATPGLDNEGGKCLVTAGTTAIAMFETVV